MAAPKTPWASESAEILEGLSPQGEAGLSAQLVARRRVQFGPNELARTERRSALLIFVAQFRSLVVLLLAAAAGVSFGFGDWLEGGAITAVILINALIGFFTELGAVRSMEALRKLTQVNVTVRRDGELHRIPAGELVPGDVVLVEGGDVVAADMRLFHASRLQANESSLTGESVPVTKDTPPLPADAILAERANMLFKGTAVTRGSGEGVVTATGMDSELGHISSLVSTAKDETTPLEKRLNDLGRKLVWVTLLVVVFTALAGIRAGKDTYLMIETAIALAVAAIPEGLPIVATLALARGMWRMAKRNALINRLAAVETLGATSVICTDKTGTLTENKMSVVLIALPGGEQIDMESPPADHPLLREALETAALCNNASLDGVGDPLEVALLEAANRADVETSGEARIGEEAFDSVTRMMATSFRDGAGVIHHVKGAPEALIEVCGDLPPAERQAWLEQNEALAEQGLRILALARGHSEHEGADESPYANLKLLALVGMVDPPRDDVRAAIARCHDSGIRVIMITGDQSPTAAYVADAVGLTEGIDSSAVVTGDKMADVSDLTSPSVFARVSPAQKLDIIAAHQKQRRVVAMTGDGVNDAPALKKADIGVAMGVRGTEAAKEAADMVLKDDAFGTIATAVEQGRIIFANIRRFVLYLMSCNLSEILIVALAASVDSPLPILPLQILFLNMVTDVFPALALGMGGGHHSMMRQPPRDAQEPILRRSEWLRIGGYSFVIAASVLSVFALALLWLETGVAEAVTIAFLSLAGAQLVHVFNMRESAEGMFVNQITRNRYVWFALAICVLLLATAIYVPSFTHILGLQIPSFAAWQLIAAGTLMPLLVGQLAAELCKRWKRSR